MKDDGRIKAGERRTRVPSHNPMPGVEGDVIDAGATTGAQLPTKAETTKEETGKPDHNPNQGDLLTPYWSKK